MTDIDSGLSGLSAALRSDEGGLVGRLAEILGDAIQELIEDELTVRIGAAPGERSMTRSTQRNGHRPKLLSTPAGDVTVGIPKLRKGIVLPRVVGAPSADRQGAVGGDHDRLHHRDLDKEG